jgi:alpha-beta hydrolase superfamily lysophospholipase
MEEHRMSPVEVHDLATEDGVLVQLAYFPPKKADAPIVIWTHGVGNSFYNTPIWKVSHLLSSKGWGAALLNNRGHDWVGMNPLDRRWTGAAYERIEDSAFDFKAGLKWLADRGHASIVIGGHSLGGLKAAYTQSHFPEENVVALAMLSSPRLPDDRDWDWSVHEKILERGRELIAEGRGQELMHVDMPTNTPALKGLMCAETYVNKYGPQACTTTLRFADRIRVPVFLLAGTKEKPQLSFSMDMERALVNAPSVTRISIEGADHMYTERHGAVAEAFAAWLARLG